MEVIPDGAVYTTTHRKSNIAISETVHPVSEIIVLKEYSNIFQLKLPLSLTRLLQQCWKTGINYITTTSTLS